MRRIITSIELGGMLIFSFIVIVVLPYLNGLMDSSCRQADFKDVPGLSAKLIAAGQAAKPDPLPLFMWQQISADGQKKLTDPASTVKDKEHVLVETFNGVIQGDSIYDDKRFAGVTLSPQTLKLKSPNQAGEEVKWLNRSLLDDGFPAELKPATYTNVPEALRVSNFTISLYGKYLCYAILAISVDMLWGYTGLLTLQQCLFFALGGYMFGMYLMRKIGTLGSHQSIVPDFLYFQGWRALPDFWKPFSSFPFAIAMAFLLPGTLALAFGYLAFRSRIKGVYFSILTQALTYAGLLLFYQNNILMGGNNGFSNYKFVLGYDITLPQTERVIFMYTGVTMLGVYLLCKWLTTTKFGKIQRAIRDSENRLLFSGYSTASYKLFIFVLTSMIAAVAGMLYVPQVGIINPSEMAPAKSIEAVVWVAIGGRGTLVGPVIGAIFVNGLRSWATRAYPDLWLIILGLLFILVVLFMPGGIVGLPAQIRGYLAKRRKVAETDATPPVAAPKTVPPAAKTSTSPVSQG